jgi:hypothetical protein
MGCCTNPGHRITIRHHRDIAICYPAAASLGLVHISVGFFMLGPITRISLRNKYPLFLPENKGNCKKMKYFFTK